jgi:hypothetical protein
MPRDEDLLDQLIAAGHLLCGTPDEVGEQVARYQDVGCDQLVFGLPGEGMAHEEVLEAIELFGDKVIPEFDLDPEHSTSRARRAAGPPKHPRFAGPVPDVRVEVIPEHALLPLR